MDKEQFRPELQEKSRSEPVADVEIPSSLRHLEPGVEYNLLIESDRLKVFESMEEKFPIYRHSSGFEFNSDTSILKTSNGELRKVAGKKSTILKLLLDRPEETVAEGKIASNIWPELDTTNPADTKRLYDNLKVHVSSLRKVISDNDRRNRLIKKSENGYMISGSSQTISLEEFTEI